MAFCHSCSSIRVGDNNDGETLIESLGAVREVSMMYIDAAYQMMETIIPQAEKGGVCQSCISDLHFLKSEIGRHLWAHLKS